MKKGIKDIAKRHSDKSVPHESSTPIDGVKEFEEYFVKFCDYVVGSSNLDMESIDGVTFQPSPGWRGMSITIDNFKIPQRDLLESIADENDWILDYDRVHDRFELYDGVMVYASSSSSKRESNERGYIYAPADDKLASIIAKIYAAGKEEFENG